MYHCHVLFYLTGHPHSTYEVIKKMPPLKGFTHDFSESETPEPELAARADVILAGLSGPDPMASLRTLTDGMKEEAQLILLADREQADRLEDFLPQVCDLWLTPMPDRELRFRFRRWQQIYKQGKDLWQAEQFLDSSINSTPQMIWYKDRDGVYKKVNSSFCEVAGKASEDIVGHDYAHTWDAAACVQSDREVMRLRKTCVVDEVIQRDGEEMLLKAYKSPLYDLDGSVMGIVGIAVNVTQERAYEREILEKNRSWRCSFPAWTVV